VTLSSLNRHAFAQRGDVGFSKVEVVKEYIGKIIPTCEIDIRETIFKIDLAEELLEGSPDFVIDCIDNTDTKTDLICYCMDKGIPLICSMGSGGK